MNNEYYYGVTRTDEYLAHYGIKGMKWGVRKAIESGNSKALGRQYRKAQKKLAKLEKRANNGKKYAKRAAMLGAGAAAAGGLAALGTTGVSNAIGGASRYASRGMAGLSRGLKAGSTSVGMLADRVGNKHIRTAMRTLGRGMDTASGAVNRKIPLLAGKTARTTTAITKWGNKTHDFSSVADAAGHIGREHNIGFLKNVSHDKRLGAVSNNTLARAGAAAVGAGLAGGAAYNAYRAATTKRAARKAAEFRKEMNQAFAGTRYGAPRRKRRR